MGFNSRNILAKDFLSGRNLRTNKIFKFKIVGEIDRSRFTLTSGLELTREDVGIVISGFNDIEKNDTLDLGGLGTRIATRLRNKVENSYGNNANQKFINDVFFAATKYLVVQ